MINYVQEYFSLTGKTAVVTGAGRGIGRAIAEGLVGAGAKVLVHYNRSESGAEELVNKIKARGGDAWMTRADLTSSREASELFNQVRKRWGSLDILVNNAGDLIKRSNIENITDELIEQVTRVNLFSAIYSVRSAIPLLKQGSQPCIVNVGSIAAHTGAGNGATLYASAKAAIHTLTRGLAKELAPEIRVNAVAPGVIMTDFHRKHSTKEDLEIVANTMPMKRIGLPEEIGPAVVFLCGKSASYITGEVIEINGGRWFA